MGWATDLQDASFRGVPFECTSTSRSGSKSLAIKQAPYSNEADVEDMGNELDNHSISAVFSGDNYKIECDNLIAAIKMTGSGELIHPVDGVMQVYIVKYTINHDAENPDYCSVSFDFINAENKEREIFVPIKSQTSISTANITEAPASNLKSFLEKLKLNDNDQLFSVVTTIQDGINKAREYLDLTKKTIDDVLSPTTWVTSLIDDFSQLVTFDTNISAITKWRDLTNRVERLSNVFNNNDKAELNKLWDATQVSSQLTITQNVIETVRLEMASNDFVSFTPVDLAVIRQKTRNVLQQAINKERESSSYEGVTQIQIYKELADQIHLQIQELIETQPPITTVKIPVHCTVHWLAHYLYADMSRSDEIIRLNPNVMNPSLLQTGMELTVYAR